MSLFAKLTHSDGQWKESEPVSEPYLYLDVHDGDIATVEYRPAGTATGRFFLGVEPRHYFEDDSASAPVNREAEAEGFSRWLREVHGRDVDSAAVLALMAPDEEADDESDDEDEDASVEDTLDRLLDLIGLPLPEGMPSDD